jgi:hypothetical protein
MKKNHYDYHGDWRITDGQGEIVKQGVVTKTCKTTEEFVKVYLNALDEMIKLDHRTFQVLMVCMKECSFCDDKHKEGSVVYNLKQFKDKCRDVLGPDKYGKPLHDDTINKYMSRLCKMGILIRKSRGEFVLNPSLFIKGELPTEVLYQAPPRLTDNENFS